MIDNNWQQTQNNKACAIQNYYNQGQFARIVHWGGSHTGTLGIWWCPVKHRDALVDRILNKAKMYSNSELIVSYDWPDVEDLDNTGKGYFEPYTVKP